MHPYRLIMEPPGLFVAGVTQPNEQEIDWYLERRKAAWQRLDPVTECPEAIIEVAGRVCYQSWHNPLNRQRHEYIQQSIIAHKHGSVLEHLWFNLLVCDLPRFVQLELVRHGEGTAFSFESQRFTDKDIRFVVPPAMRYDEEMRQNFENDCTYALAAYHDMLNMLNETMVLDDAVLRRKRIKEAARALLPGAVAGDGMISLNARAARHIIQTRSDGHADLSMREFAYELYSVLARQAPAVFEDARFEAVDHWPPRIVFGVEKV